MRLAKPASFLLITAVVALVALYRFGPSPSPAEKGITGAPKNPELDFPAIGGNFRQFYGKILEKGDLGYWAQDSDTGEKLYLDTSRLAFGRTLMEIGANVHCLYALPASGDYLPDDVVKVNSMFRWIYSRHIPANLWVPPRERPYIIVVCLKQIPDDDFVPEYKRL